MTIELQVENFQSWEKFGLTLDGLTVLVGASNVGKSATNRALKALLRNTLNASQIRVGSTGIKIDAVIDGHRVIAERPKKDSVTYQVDGEGFSKLDGKIPERVADLGYGELVIGKVRLDPIFSKQFGSQFILEEGETALNTILGAFSSTEKLEFGKRTANLRIGERNAEAKVLAKEMRVVEERRAKIAPLAERATATQTLIDSLEPQIVRQEQVLALLDTLIVHTERLQRLQEVIAGVTVPDTEPVAHGIQVIQAVAVLAVTLARHQRIQVAVDQLVVPVADKAVQLHLQVLNAGQAATAQKRLQEAKAATDAIAVCVAGWTDIVNLFKHGKTLREAEEALTAFNSSSARSKTTIAALEEHTSEIDGLISEVTRLAKSIRQLDGLVTARQAGDVHTKALPGLETEIEQAQATLDRITTEHQAHQQALAVEAAQKQAAKEAAAAAAACAKCETCGSPLKK